MRSARFTLRNASGTEKPHQIPSVVMRVLLAFCRSPLPRHHVSCSAQTGQVRSEARLRPTFSVQLLERPRLRLLARENQPPSQTRGRRPPEGSHPSRAASVQTASCDLRAAPLRNQACCFAASPGLIVALHRARWDASQSVAAASTVFGPT
jgi:hypothetical protein